jgi:enoyl-CoA hydratase
MFEEFRGNRTKAFESVRKMQDCFTRIENFDMVVIAAINGLALGGGCELAVACDIRVAAQNAIIGTPEVKLGIIPGAGGTQRLARLLGKGWAKMIVLGGEPVSASEALSIGLVEKIVPAGEALIESKKLAKVFLKRGPLALKNGKRAINEGSNMPLKEGLIREAELITDLFLTEDIKEGAKAFFEKRSPVFKGK